MKKFKNVVKSIVAFTIAAGLAACGSSTPSTSNSDEPNAPAAKPTAIKIGINGEEGRIWKYVKGELAKENIQLEVISFSDYIIPNTALVDGEVDANAFQTEIFFNNFKAQSGADLSVLCYTILAPMGIYPGTVSAIADIPDGGKIAIPNDPSNGGRALILLQAAGLIKVDESKGLLPTVKDITENPKNLEIIEMAAPQIPTALDELSVAVINNGVARNAGLSPLEASIFIEDASWDYMTNYYNIIAVQTKDLEKPELKRLAEIYQSEENVVNIQEEYKGSSVPAF